MKNKEGSAVEFEGYPVYQQMMDVLLGSGAPEDLKTCVHPNFTGYGSAAHEIFKGRNDLMEMARRQMEQYDSLQLEVQRTALSGRFLDKGETYLISEEFLFINQDDNHAFPLRVTTLLQQTDKKWLVTHMHGSTPDSDIAEEEAFPEQGLRKKNEELEAKIRERTRELEIEASLERVRSRAMAMQASEELSELVITVFRELSNLDMVLTRCLIWIFNPIDDSGIAWMANSEDPDVADSYLVPYHDHPAYHSYLKGWKSRESKWEYVLEGEVKDRWDEILVYGYFKSLPENIKLAMKEPQRVVLSGSFNNFGVIQTASLESLSEASRDILNRFSRVFEQSYTRFLDLKKAEAQAREAQIEAALERVRAATMAMHKTEDISGVAVVFLNQLKQLKLNFIQAWIDVFHLEDGYIDIWFSPLEGVYEEPRHLQLPSAIFEDTSIKSWKAGNRFSYVSLKSKEEVDALVAACDAGSSTDYFSHFQEILKLDRLEFVDANHKYGTVSKSSFEKATKEEEEILYRFAKVFEQTYTRFLDLKKAEAQAREAQIELALERIRAQATAMQNSSELQTVIRVIFEQMAGLDINAEHAGIVVDYSPGQDWSFWVAENQDIPSKITIPYLDSLWDRQYTEAKEKGTDFFTTLLGFEEKNNFYKALLKHIPGLTKEAREFYLSCPGLAISTVVEEDIGLYIENFSGIPYSEEENGVLKRFGSVFQQTYTRFLDLKKAEAQAREAQIEAALEKVRAGMMAMHKSDELRMVIKTIFEQLQGLDFGADATAVIIYDENYAAEHWFSGYSFETYPKSYTIPYVEKFSYCTDLVDAWKNGVDFEAFPMEGKEKTDYGHWLLENSDFKDLPEEFTVHAITPDRLVLNDAFNKYGMLEVLGPEALSEDNAEILKRFSSVFEQTYTRFIDLKKAEAQAREAQIEASLERVRSQTMAMHQSSDLEKSAEIVFEELEKLNLSIERSGIGIFDRNARSCQLWTTGLSAKGKKELMTGTTSLTIHPMLTATFDAWEVQEPLSYVLEGTELKKYYEIVSKSEFVLSEELLDKSASLPKEYYHYTPFGAGGLYFFSDSEPPAADIQIMRRFAEVFDMTYTRYEDLKKAEKQAREAQIEAALEKVRSRTMAMQHSDELPEAANVLFLEIQALGIPAWSCGYNILAEDKKSARCWMSSEGTLQKPFTLRLWGEDSFEEMGEFTRGDQTFLVQELGGTALEEHYAHMLSFPDLLPIFEDIKKEGLSLPTYQINHLCKFNHGFLLFITYEEVPGVHDIFKRFTTVFEQTYTRFLDLKRAEAQARESRIETALERVRARALAMQEPEELKEVVQVLRQEMGLLGVEELETSSIYINDAEVQKAECWFAIKDLRAEEKVMVTDHFTLDLTDTWVGREMLKFYESDADKVSIAMKGDQRKEWIDYCETHSKPLKGYYGEEIPDRIYHLYKFSDGAIGAATPGDLSEESWGLLKRAASAFSLAYSRFKDLTQARLDLRRLKEEKKRAEDALKELQLTQQQLVHAEKMASLGELTAGIAHEIQNPLNFVNNFSDVSRELLEELLEEMEKGDTEEVDAIARDVIQNLEKIVHHGRRADSIVKGMLQHSRTGDGKKELTDLNALADEYLRLAYHGLRAKDKSFNAAMKTDLDPKLPKVDMVPQDIGRVLLNLITNAFHAVSDRKQKEPEGFEPTVWVSTRKTADGAEIAVRDNGGGIPDEIRDKIFQPFFTTKPTGEGTGLGLSMSYDIVTKGHGGELTLSDCKEGGTEFRIQLPIQST